jgi:hypothetical protein
MIRVLAMAVIVVGFLLADWAVKRAKKIAATGDKNMTSPGVYEISQRTKRIRTGAVLIVASMVAVLVLAGFAGYPYQYKPKGVFDSIRNLRFSYVKSTHEREFSSSDRIWDMSINKDGKRVVVEREYGHVPYSVVFAIGMGGVGLRAIMMVVGLTTPKQQGGANG